uniref:Replication stress response regulator SDE2 n=1 Tax=Dracunculus medinensis TaxID=318479 RepID=A0A0N4U4L8_DRAME
LNDLRMLLATDIKTVSELSLLPSDAFYVTVNGQIVDWKEIRDGSSFVVHFRLRGGKGGFGSLLRSFRIHRSTNQLMCRDLTGRRLADVKEEERLRNWIAKAEERAEEKRRRRLAKYERLKSGPAKHEMNDPHYIRQREKILDETDDAFDAGMFSHCFFIIFIDMNVFICVQLIYHLYFYRQETSWPVQQRNICNNAVKYDEINLDEYESAEALQKLNLDHLKHALEARGMKCGGSLAERAARLFSVKNLKPEEYPKSVLVKKR